MKGIKSKVKEAWQKADLRSSLQGFMQRPENVFKKEFEDSDKTEDIDISEKSLTTIINENLLRYKEIKMIYEKTGILPSYFVYILVFCLTFIFIGYLENYLTHLIATLYPMYISIKTLQNPESTKEDIIQWLTYWVVYSVFINFEGVFGALLQFIPFYFFIKVIFLLVLFLPQYNGAAWFYDKLLKNLFNKYENHIIEMSNEVVKKISIKNGLNDK
jgi:receptor expression-enhancing protein 5/6